MLTVSIAKTKEQIDEAYRIRETVFVKEQNVPIEEEMDEHDDFSIHFLGHNDIGQPVAASRLRFVAEFGKLERICVLEEERGKYHGQKIIKTMEDYIRDEGYYKAKLNAQTYAIKFYEQLGYSVISEEFMDAGIPHVTMVKSF
ncbi:GNAT family N-acetyltransferase [Halalkalibacillus halophilus]|uniref:GNAT family N-acetyltransferase n=1 Tax=Halalkalibacillus halophilus TaxID=392827 RepID=UPI000414E236|nr:GNAT family N-acetyltransferase [Halalkalibacillus halophilus]